MEAVSRYPVEVLHEDSDDGSMVASAEALADAVVGHRIVAVDHNPNTRTVLTLDDGTRVHMAYVSDCCAYAEVTAFLLHPELVDHVITGVGTTGEYTTWHIFADLGDVLELSVDWSCGNPFYYGYGFSIRVEGSGAGDADVRAPDRRDERAVALRPEVLVHAGPGLRVQPGVDVVARQGEPGAERGERRSGQEVSPGGFST